MKATCNYPRARFGGLLFPPWSFNLGLLLRIPQRSGCAESYSLPNRKIHEREKKNRELSLTSFLVSFYDLVLLSFCWNCCVQERFGVLIFFFYDGLLTLAYHENPEIVVLKLHFLSLRSLFVFSVWICLQFMVFFGSRKGKRRECGRLATM
jgi:hypothetical protein